MAWSAKKSSCQEPASCIDLLCTECVCVFLWVYMYLNTCTIHMIHVCHLYNDNQNIIKKKKTINDVVIICIYIYVHI
jgi:hypothetical protein